MKLFAVDLYSLTPEDIAAIEALGYEVTVAKPDQAPDEVCRDEEIEVALCEHGYLKKHMGKMPNVKMIQMTYAGLDLMGPELFEVYKDAAICGGSGIYGVPLAEWSVSKVLDIYRRERHFEQHRKEHKWSWEGSTETAELWGKTVLLLGTGDIGAACARRFGAFGCRVIGVNTTGRAVEGFDECHPISALDPLLPAADVVVVCLPRTPAT
ncbi:MAG: hypothetical protein IJF59_01555, partial [Clostridia bacterium]|nr:hypothetical protein [Clostridia bacterium]